ncbi:precorrin-2 dehydrogenase/sirohydrochlorin ferrochelatase family protein [Sphingobium boeckii]|uniref:precorrin-2 dehydrogenase n=1 Tax=Sphingobium boeckii TaxID=1082345 RepID=A0A7W9AJF9_9SPHN|nr:bifunctional precorrin-2 dehydrogenase/sirohydrochlorin ferrochelatase [Sphingobium boeckii]MBB5686581.1 uroporphyrin-III C-methyltransferase/precorrin-2 dehydrogenase/sirohydrochlorin ferrochelatase [Sphingobium boeckii]
MNSLPVFLRLQGRPVILLGEGEARAAKARLLERAGAEIVGEDTDAALAIVAIEDEAEAEAAVVRLKARGVLVNATDRPALCDFTLPAIVDREPVLIAIGTGGASAGLAKALRQRLETLLPPSLGDLATRLFGARAAIRARWPDATARRKAIDAALDGPLDPLSALSEDAVTSWLQSADQAEATALITIVVRSDDPDDLTLGEARLLGRADHVYHSPAVHPAILDRARADAGRTRTSAPPRAFAGLSLYLLGKAQP